MFHRDWYSVHHFFCEHWKARTRPFNMNVSKFWIQNDSGKRISSKADVYLSTVHPTTSEVIRTPGSVIIGVIMLHCHPLRCRWIPDYRNKRGLIRYTDWRTPWAENGTRTWNKCVELMFEFRRNDRSNRQQKCLLIF